MFDLSKKVAVVTGGAGHLGAEMTTGLLEAGAKVYIASLNKGKRDSLIDKLNSQGLDKAKGVSLDFRIPENVDECFGKVFEKEGRIDILVNNAAGSAGGKVDDITEENWNIGIDGTINNVYRCTKTVVPFMKKNHYGRIVNIASMYGVVAPDPSIYGDTGYDNPPNYGAGKAAVIQYTRYCACHLASWNIRVNSISPGPFPNPEIQKNGFFMEQLKKKNPMNRIGQPQELKGAVLFLASDASSFVTGINIPVDGGWTAW